MPTRIGINGFGRIGRYLIRLLADNRDIELAAVNARADNAALAHMLKYDSTHGHFPYPVSVTERGLNINGRDVPVTRKPAGEWDWAGCGADLVVETTGTIKDRAGAARHLERGARKVVVSAPMSDADAIIVMGVNQDVYDPARHNVVSAASCTTNCLAPAAMVVDKTFGIRHGLMTTIHSYTMSQRILDGSHKDARRSRSAAVSMIPTSTGAARAIGLVYPALKGKLDGMAVRVPTPNVSLVDFTAELDRETDAAAVNGALRAAAEGALKDNMGYSDEPLVSIDYTGSTFGGVVDSLCTTVMDKTMLKLILWYDNEAGFTNQLLRLLRLVASR